MSGWRWRVWRAFENDPQPDRTELWRALAKACRGLDGRINGAEFERWIDVLVEYRHGEA